MKKLIQFILLGVCTSAFSQSITLEDIWKNYTFYAPTTQDIQWYNGHYFIEYENGSFVISDALAEQPKQDLVTSQVLKPAIEKLRKECALNRLNVSRFILNKNQDKILLLFNEESIYRYSTKSYLAVWEIQNEKLIKIQNNKVLYPEFSPTGRYLSYIKQNNIYIFDFIKNEELQVTFDGKENNIINGKADWLYEEEFEMGHAYKWSSDERNIYYLQLNESNVPTHTIIDSENSIYTYKYPRVGDNISEVSLFCYDLKSNKNTEWQKFESNSYTPRLELQNNVPLTFNLNREQNKLVITQHFSSKKSRVAYEEKSDTYLELPYSFVTDSSIFITSEKSGFNQLYELKGNKSNQLTFGNNPIDKVHGTTKFGIYYSKVLFPHDSRFVYLKSFRGKDRIVANNSGINEIEISKNGQYLFLTHSTRFTPPVQKFTDRQGGEISLLNANETKANILNQFDLPNVENLLFENNKGDTMAFILMKPKDFDSTKSYSLLVHVYGGPGYQLIRDEYNPFNFFFHAMLTQKDVIIAIIDPTGSGGQGKSFKNKTYKRLGQTETEDLINFASTLSDKRWVDSNKIGIWGWSYGGYLSSKAILASDVYKTAISVAPVSDWKLYDCAYTERYQGIIDENEINYLKSSSLEYRNDIEGNFLLIHGTADDNVHIEHSYKLQQNLINRNQKFDSFYYPYKNHGIYGGNTRLHLYEMMTNYLLKHLNP